MSRSSSSSCPFHQHSYVLQLNEERSKRLRDKHEIELLRRDNSRQAVHICALETEVATLSRTTVHHVV